MTTRARLLQILRWCLAFYTIAAAGLLIAQTLAIYQAGTADANISANGVYLHDVFSAKIVAAHFAAIAIPIYGWIVAAVLSLAAVALLQPGMQRLTIRREPLDQMCRALRWVSADTLAGEGDGVCVARRERQRIRTCVWMLAVLGVLCLATAALYVVFDSPFGSRELEDVMGKLLLRVLPLASLEMAAAGAVVIYLNAKAERALPAVQTLTAVRKATHALAGSPTKRVRLTIARAGLYVLAITLVIWGIFNQGMRDVLIKAINICTECVGLG